MSKDEQIIEFPGTKVDVDEITMERMEAAALLGEVLRFVPGELLAYAMDKTGSADAIIAAMVEVYTNMNPEDPARVDLHGLGEFLAERLDAKDDPEFKGLEMAADLVAALVAGGLREMLLSGAGALSMEPEDAPGSGD